MEGIEYFCALLGIHGHVHADAAIKGQSATVAGFLASAWSDRVEDDLNPNEGFHVLSIAFPGRELDLHEGLAYGLFHGGRQGWFFHTHMAYAAQFVDEKREHTGVSPITGHLGRIWNSNRRLRRGDHG
ncbi:hypothetical protein [Polaromonas sp.]|uniref:hypothetical protein n=1 Tax=Polaromonas sp. TaxID=1869339 RepID=UPI00326780F6